MIRLMGSTFSHEIETKQKLCSFITESSILSMNKKCKKFEEDFAQHQGRKYAVLYNSGSSANLALIQALVNQGKLEHSDSVGFSALTWATNVMPLLQLCMKPIPIDVSLSTLNIHSEHLLETLEKSSLDAVFLTNLLGFCGDIDKIKEICEEKNILLIEDNCESLGSIYQGKKLGNFGLASTFSFFVGHHMSTIEGGMVCTDDKELYDMLCMVRAHGWARDLDVETTEALKNKNSIEDFYNRYTFYHQGYNLRPTEITGFLGIEQLQFIDTNNKKRAEIFDAYSSVSKNNNDIIDLDVSHMDFVSNFAFPLIFSSKELFEAYKKKFEAVAEIRPIVGGSINEQPFFKNYKGDYSCKNAELIHKQGFYIPNHPELTQDNIDQLKELMQNG